MCIALFYLPILLQNLIWRDPADLLTSCGIYVSTFPFAPEFHMCSCSNAETWLSNHKAMLNLDYQSPIGEIACISWYQCDLLESCINFNYNMVCSALFSWHALYPVHCTIKCTPESHHLCVPRRLVNSINCYFLIYAAKLKCVNFYWNNFIGSCLISTLTKIYGKTLKNEEIAPILPLQLQHNQSSRSPKVAALFLLSTLVSIL